MDPVVIVAGSVHHAALDVSMETRLHGLVTCACCCSIKHNEGVRAAEINLHLTQRVHMGSTPMGIRCCNVRINFLLTYLWIH